jgi:hypothetical protein
MILASADPPDLLSIPKSPQALWVERLLWVFLFSFAFDYRASLAREGAGGSGVDQLLFLGACVASTLGIVALGWRHLTVRPGAWLITFWGLFVGFMIANAVLQGVQPGRSIRVALPFVFCLFAMMNSHIAGCVGIRPSRIVTPVLVVGCINVVWRIIHGFLFKEVSIETVRTEVMSPANNWIIAWISCAILLRGRWSWSLLIACAVVFGGVFITITRSLIFPMVAGGLTSMVCFFLCVHWGMLPLSSFFKRMAPVAAVGALALFAIIVAAITMPTVVERWNERLFHNAATVNLSKDISFLTRVAEADAMAKILKSDPVHFINGRGIGASYYWDRAYLPEITLVIPKGEDNFDDIWFAGHSIWTYSIFSNGVIGFICYVTLLAGVGTFSLKAARANASDPGPDQWLAFLPLIATCCILSESLTSNPFQERLLGILYGMMAGLPQAFMIRASWLHTYSRP